MTIPIPSNEHERVELLHQLDLVESGPDQAFDELVKLASHICGTPMALVTLIDEDRQHFKAKKGLDGEGTDRRDAFCAHALGKPDILVVDDPTHDARFRDNPFVLGDPNVRFYAGAPLMTHDGYGLGTLCVIDDKPRQLSPEQLDMLDALRKQAVAMIEQKRTIQIQKKYIDEVRSAEARIGLLNQQLDQRNREVSHLFQSVSNELRTPIRGMATLADWLHTDFAESLDGEALESLELLKSRAEELVRQLDRLEEFATVSSRPPQFVHVDTGMVWAEMTGAMLVPDTVRIHAPETWPVVRTDPERLYQAFELVLDLVLQRLGGRAADMRLQATDSGEGPALELRYADPGFAVAKAGIEAGAVTTQRVSIPLLKHLLRQASIGLELDHEGDTAVFRWTFEV